MNALVGSRYGCQPSVDSAEEKRNLSSSGKNSMKPGVWLGADGGEVLRLPLSGDGGGQSPSGLALMSYGNAGEGDTGDGAMRAARWLMPNLPPQLIAEALEWSAGS